ncbi:MAG: aspartate-semialdehyde dehydrogenase [Marinilabiliales bacterium]|nr:MAG: aspartate-semialdehyde dehydrogenase [Marinilabiliales bacterium]
MKIAIVGATGLVGRQMIQLLEQSKTDNIDLIPVATVQSVGKKILFRGREITVTGIENAIEKKPDIALFSAGGGTSKQYAPLFAAQGTYVIDNSSAWRREKDVPLVVPEVNGDIIKPEDYIIANPNCSTIQLVMALAPVQKQFGIKRVVVSTYQSVSGSGKKAIQQMEAERRGEEAEKVYPWPIDKNLIPHGGDFLDNGFTMEEDKLLFESRKILDCPEMEVAATVVRVPVTGGHSISAAIECEKACPASEVTNLLHSMAGVKVIDNPRNNEYPMPLFAEGKDEVFVGRIRNDLFRPDIIHMWIVSDNLRKGAATNAVQILESLIDHKFFA